MHGVFQTREVHLSPALQSFDRAPSCRRDGLTAHRGTSVSRLTELGDPKLHPKPYCSSLNDQPLP